MKVSIFTVVLNVSKELRLIAVFVFMPVECNCQCTAVGRGTLRRLEPTQYDLGCYFLCAGCNVLFECSVRLEVDQLYTPSCVTDKVKPPFWNQENWWFPFTLQKVKKEDR